MASSSIRSQETFDFFEEKVLSKYTNSFKTQMDHCLLLGGPQMNFCLLSSSFISQTLVPVSGTMMGYA